MLYSGFHRGSGGIGRRASLRSWWPKGRRGSSPFFRTNLPRVRHPPRLRDSQKLEFWNPGQNRQSTDIDLCSLVRCALALADRLLFQTALSGLGLLHRELVATHVYWLG